MSNEQIIKKVFDEKLNIETMKEQILFKSMKKKTITMNIYFKLAIPICLIIIISITILNSNLPISQHNSLNEDHSINYVLNINEIDSIHPSKQYADAKEVNQIMIPYFEFLSDIKIPVDLDGEYKTAIYVKETKESQEYDQLSHYRFSYFNTTNHRMIEIAFSNTILPMQDNYITEAGKTSRINNIELVIYKSKESYIVTFNYHNYNFYIETTDINEHELLVLLESIIK